MIMDPPLVNEASFSAANPSSYTLSEMWPFTAINADPASGGPAAGLRLQVGNLGPGFGERDGSAEESTVTEQSGGGNGIKRRYLSSEDESSKLVSTTCSGNELNDSNGKRQKVSGTMNCEIDNPKADVEASSATDNKPAEQSSTPSEPPKQDYIHVRARRGQATDSHSLAERARREKISDRMKVLQDLVPGCNKVIGKALVLDEIINYVQSLQHQVEFLSMKLEALNTRMNMNPMIEGYHPKEFVAQPFDASGMMYGSQATRECDPGSEPEWLHMQVGGSFARTS